MTIELLTLCRMLTDLLARASTDATRDEVVAELCEASDMAIALAEAEAWRTREIVANG